MTTSAYQQASTPLHSGKTLTLLEPTQADYQQATTFIKAGFARNYNAVISEFMPYLMTIADSKITAVMGIRPATAPLFIEQYLERPIETTLGDSALKREHIVEVGNLVSDNRHNTLSLFIVVTRTLYCAGYQQMVFCATGKVAAILRRVGASLDPIVEADSQRVGASLAQWGSYYEHHPTVMRLDLAQANHLISNSPLLNTFAAPFEEAITAMASRLHVVQGVVQGAAQ
jgi:hypothetical protein